MYQPRLFQMKIRASARLRACSMLVHLHVAVACVRERRRSPDVPSYWFHDPLSEMWFVGMFCKSSMTAED